MNPREHLTSAVVERACDLTRQPSPSISELKGALKGLLNLLERCQVLPEAPPAPVSDVLFAPSIYLAPEPAAKLIGLMDDNVEHRVLIDVFRILSDAPELNMSNYTEDQVGELNTAVIQAYRLIHNHFLKEKFCK